MNNTFVRKYLKKGDIVRITTKEAVGVVGRVEHIDIELDGIVLKEVEAGIIEQVENSMSYDRVLFPLSEIKYIFIFNLTTKPVLKDGSNDS